MGVGTKQGTQLHLVLLGVIEAVTNGAIAQEGILFLRKVHVGDFLVATHVKRTDDDGLALHDQADLLVCRELLLLGGKLLAVHEEELGAEQANALGVVLDGCVRVAGVADVCDEQDFLAVGGNRGFTAVSLEGSLVRSELASCLAIGLKLLVGRIDDDVALSAIYDYQIAGLDVLGRVGNRQNRRDLHSAADDGGVGGTTTGLGHDSDDMLFVDVCCHRRRKLTHDHDGILGKRGEIHKLLAQQSGKQTGAHVGDIGGTLAEELVFHLGEHVVVHGIGIVHCLLGAHTLGNCHGHGIDDAVVLSKLDVSVENARLFLQTLSLHVCNLLVGHCHEGVTSGGITCSLCLGILNLLRGVAQIRHDCDARYADSDAIRGIYSTVHCNLLLSIRLLRRLTACSKQNARHARVGREYCLMQSCPSAC